MHARLATMTAVSVPAAGGSVHNALDTDSATTATGIRRDALATLHAQISNAAPEPAFVRSLQAQRQQQPTNC